MLSSVAAACLTLCVLTSNPATLDVPGAYSTVQSAIDAANPGDTVHVRAGTYDEALVFKAGITLEGEGKDRVTVRRPAADGPVLTVSRCGDGMVRGISFEHLNRPAKDNAEAKPSAIVEITDSTAELFDCTIRNSAGSGIRIRGKSKCKVLSCTVANNLRAGIAASGPEVAATLVGNTCTENSSGIAFQEDAHGAAKINHCDENTYSGIRVSGKGNPVLFGNTCSKNSGFGIVCEKDSTLVSQGNRCEFNKASGIALRDNSVATVRYGVQENNAWNGIWYSPSGKSKSKGNTYLNNGEFGKPEAMHLFLNGQFSDIETIAARLRRDKTMSKEGEWELPNLYDGIATTCKLKDKTVESYMGTIQEWRKAYPNSITCAIAEADGYCTFAWRARGSGWASTVTQEGWQTFYALLEKGLKAVEAAEKLPERDPQLYVVKEKIMLGLGKTSPQPSHQIPPVLAMLMWWTNSQITLPSPAEEAFLRGVAIEPTYYPLYYARVAPLLPRWGGSPPEMVDFAERSAQATAKLEDQSLYARIATSALRTDGRDNYCNSYSFSWPRIRQGYRDILKHFPESDFRLNMFCLMACLYGDQETAKALFAQISDVWNDEVWKDKADFIQWKTWAAK